MTLRRLSLVLLLAVTAFAYRAHACETDASNYATNHFNPNFRNNTNQDLGDYGLIFQDAIDRNCSGGSWSPQQGAYRALLNKINSTFTYQDCGSSPGMHNTPFVGCSGPFQGWLEGVNVSLIFSSALLIGGHGDLTTELDQALMRVRDSYNGATSPYCGFTARPGFPTQWSPGDTCMDDYSIAASAFAWIALYERMRGRDATAFVSQARGRIAQTFRTYDSVCIFDPTVAISSTRGQCNIDTGSMTESQQAAFLKQELFPNPNLGGHTLADIIALNRGENIVYGAGLMTAVSSAFVALDEGGFFPSLTDSQQVIAAAFMDEAQRKTATNGANFGFDCAIFDAAANRSDTQGCADGNATPMIYDLNSKAANLYYPDYGRSSFYDKYVSYKPADPGTTIYDHANGGYIPIFGPFQFNTFSVAPFTKDANDTNENWGRQVFYHYLGFGWNTIDNTRYQANTDHTSGDARPRLWGYLDDHDPIGYLDGIDANGVAIGWTCDNDLPTWTNAVDFYVNGTSGQRITRAFANVASEPAVNSLCGGGYSHRFSVQMPSWTKGQLIYAYGLDATWRGITLLNGWTCAQHPACTW